MEFIVNVIRCEIRLDKSMFHIIHVGLIPFGLFIVERKFEAGTSFDNLFSVGMLIEEEWIDNHRNSRQNILLSTS